MWEIQESPPLAHTQVRTGLALSSKKVALELRKELRYHVLDRHRRASPKKAEQVLCFRKILPSARTQVGPRQELSSKKELRYHVLVAP